MSKTVLLRAPLCTVSGYSVHARQVARWLFDKEEELDLDISTELLNWGHTGWITDVEAEDGLIGRMLQASNNQKPFYDVTIQLQLCNEFNPGLGRYNIGMTAGVETDKCNPKWIEAINRMNLIIVPSEFTKQTFLDTGGVETEIVVIPECFTDEVKDPSNASIDLDGLLKSDFNFLVFGQFTGNNPENDRKNLAYTLKYLSEVLADRPGTGVIVKTNMVRNTKLDRLQTSGILNKLVGEIKKSAFPKIYLLHGTLTNKEVAGLYVHPKVKAFVTLSRGEGFCGLDSTPIVTKTGIKRLDSIKIGELVLTHKNNWKPVTKYLSREYSGEMIQIKPYNGYVEDITLTPNHNVFVFSEISKTYTWKSCGELVKNDILCLPKSQLQSSEIFKLDISQYITGNNFLIEKTTIKYLQSNGAGKTIPRFIPLDKKFGKLLGYYFSEGCADTHAGINFSLNKKEKLTLAVDIANLMNEIFNISKYKIRESSDSERLALNFYSKIAGSLLHKLCNGTARNKFLIDDIYSNSNQEFIDGFLAGLFLGDGHLDRNKFKISLELGTEKGIRQIRQMLLAKGIIVCSNKSHKSGKIRGHNYDNFYYRLRIANKDSYNKFVEFFNQHCPSTNLLPFNTLESKKGKRKAWVDGDYILFKIKELKKINHQGLVYNLSVQDDESYSTENFVVHNCLPMLDAAASGLPVFAPGWSGHMDFMKHGKFQKVEHKLVPIHETRIDNNIFMKGVQWAQPSEHDFKRRISRFIDSHETPKEWAMDLRKKLLPMFSFEAISKLYDSVLIPILK